MRGKDTQSDDFVLEKNIFLNIFEKDIRRVYIYKKAERLAKAIHLITPAFVDSVSLRNRIDRVAVGLVDAACLPPGAARLALSRELLALSSVLSIARTGGLLSSMNADLIAHEAHLLLQEVAAYEEPRLFLDDAPTLADIARRAPHREREVPRPSPQARPRIAGAAKQQANKGHEAVDVKDVPQNSRKDAVLDVLKKHEEGASIKDISTIVRAVSEKTIQRELQALIEAGLVRKEGERRWSTYYIV